jgi:hypothetical protein
MAITYIHRETGDKVAKEPWRWQAQLSDSELNQFEIKDGQALFHRFSEIDFSKLGVLKLINDHYPAIEVRIPKGAKPIHYYKNAILRHTQTLNDGETVNWEERVKWYVIGYQLDKQKTVLAVTDANKIIMTNDPDSLNVYSKGAY